MKIDLLVILSLISVTLLLSIGTNNLELKQSVDLLTNNYQQAVISSNQRSDALYQQLIKTREDGE